MRVIQVNKFHYLRGGSERYYFDVANLLRRAGHQVQFLSMQHPRNTAAGPDDQFVAEVDYHAKLRPWQKLTTGFRSIYNRQAARLARKLATGGPPPIAHLHNIAHQLTPSIVRAFADCGVPLVQTLHDYKLVCPNSLLMTEGSVCHRCQGGRFYEAVKHRCVLDSRAASAAATTEAYLHRLLGSYNQIDRFLCPSRFMLETVASLGIARERLIHLPYFLPAEDYEPAGAPDRPVCVYVGRLAKEKGVATLIEAMARLSNTDWTLRVLGEGPLRESLEETAARRCPGRVEFLGYRNGKQLHDTIRQAAFSIVPSEWYENLPFAVLETFALGRPVLGARIGGIPELVEDGVTGRLHTSGDIDCLAEALTWMTQQADLATLGRQARERIEQQHNESQHLERLTGIYGELLGATAA